MTLEEQRGRFRWLKTAVHVRRFSACVSSPLCDLSLAHERRLLPSQCPLLPVPCPCPPPLRRAAWGSKHPRPWAPASPRSCPRVPPNLAEPRFTWWLATPTKAACSRPSSWWRGTSSASRGSTRSEAKPLRCTRRYVQRKLRTESSHALALASSSRNRHRKRLVSDSEGSNRCGVPTTSPFIP